MLYTRVEDEMPGLLTFPVFVVAVEDAPLFEALDALDKRSRTDLRLQGERPVGLLDSNPVPVDLAVALGGLDQLQVHVLRRLAARALAAVLAREFVVPALEVLDPGPQVLVSTQPFRPDIERLIGTSHHAQLCHGAAGGQVVVCPGFAVAVDGWQVDHEHHSAQLLKHRHEAPQRLLHVGVSLGVRVVDDYYPAAPQPDVIPTGERCPALAPRLGEVPDADDAHGRFASACEGVYLLRTLGNP